MEDSGQGISAQDRDGGGYLRHRLAETDSRLYEGLLECWRRADEWLSALGLSHDSSNSYPHLRNVEHHLDHVVSLLEANGDSGGYGLRFSGAELWLLLAGVLFHDIGRLKRDEKKSKNGKKSGLIPPDCWFLLLPEDKASGDWGTVQAFFGKEDWRQEAPWQKHSALRFLAKRPECQTCFSRMLDAEKEKSETGGSKKRFDCPQETLCVGPSGLRCPDDSRCSIRNRHCPAFCLACVREGWHRKGMMELRHEDAAPEKDHAVHSFEMLREPQVYLELGISAPGLVDSLARICLFHGDEPAIRTVFEPGMLNTVVLEPYGTIREREIASLLFLADHMDSSFLRVFPQYLRQHRDTKVIGRFRQQIRGVTVVTSSRMIITELGDWAMSLQTRRALESLWDRMTCHPVGGRLFVELGFEHLAAGFRDLRPRRNVWWNTFCPGVQSDIDARAHKRDDDREFCNQNEDGCPAPSLLDRVLEDMRISPRFWRPGSGLFADTRPDEVHAIREDAQADLLKELAKDVAILRVVLNDLRRNAEALDRVGFQLSGIGMPLWAWLVEYKEHLYAADGRETFEPIFTREYLQRVADAMWRLTCEVFGQSEFTYEALAAYLREADVEKVRTAVRRISIVTRDMTNESEGAMDRPFDEVVWVGQTLWKWNVRGPARKKSPLLRATAKAWLAVVRFEEWLKRSREWQTAVDNWTSASKKGGEKTKKAKEDFCEAWKRAKDESLFLIGRSGLSEVRRACEMTRGVWENLRATQMEPVPTAADSKALLKAFASALTSAGYCFAKNQEQEADQILLAAARLLMTIVKHETHALEDVPEVIRRLVAQSAHHITWIVCRMYAARLHGAASLEDHLQAAQGGEAAEENAWSEVAKELRQQAEPVLNETDALQGTLEKELLGPGQLTNGSADIATDVEAMHKQWGRDTAKVLQEYEENAPKAKRTRWTECYLSNDCTARHLITLTCLESPGVAENLLDVYREHRTSVLKPGGNGESLADWAEGRFRETLAKRHWPRLGTDHSSPGRERDTQEDTFGGMIAMRRAIDDAGQFCCKLDNWSPLKAIASSSYADAEPLLDWAARLQQMAEFLEHEWPERPLKTEEFSAVTGQDVCRRIQALANPYCAIPEDDDEI